MKKRVLSLCLALAFVFVSAFSSVAATKSGIIELSDLKRFQELVASTRGKNARIINYQKLGNDWMVHLEVRDAENKGDQCEGDFRVRFSSEAPAQGTNLGPCWYWFGLFDNTNNICGYGIAVREYQAMAGQSYTYPTPHNWSIPELQ